MPIIISVEPQDASIVEALVADPVVKGDPIIRDRVSGGSELLHAMISLTSVD